MNITKMIHENENYLPVSSVPLQCDVHFKGKEYILKYT